MEYLVLRSTNQSVLYLIKTALYTQFQETAVDGFESEQNSENSGNDEVIGDSHLTNSSSDIDYEVWNVEQENNEKVQRLYLQLLKVVTATKFWELSSTGFT